jgi:hypothetical protein
MSAGALQRPRTGPSAVSTCIPGSANKVGRRRCDWYSRNGSEPNPPALPVAGDVELDTRSITPVQAVACTHAGGGFCFSAASYFGQGMCHGVLSNRILKCPRFDAQHAQGCAARTKRQRNAVMSCRVYCTTVTIAGSKPAGRPAISGAR